MPRMSRPSLAPGSARPPQNGSRRPHAEPGVEPFAGIDHHRYARGAHLLEQGFGARKVGLVRMGLVKLAQTAPNGRSAIVGLRGRDALLGVGPALLGVTQPVTAIAVTECDVAWVDVAHFARALNEDSDASRFVHFAHCLEIERHLAQAAGLACLSARERLEEFLRFLREEVALEGPAATELPLKDWELAQLLAVTPQYLSRLMHELRDEGVIARRGSHWIYFTRDGRESPSGLVETGTSGGATPA